MDGWMDGWIDVDIQMYDIYTPVLYCSFFNFDQNINNINKW